MYEHVEAKIRRTDRYRYCDAMVVELLDQNRIKVVWDSDLSSSVLPHANLRHHDDSRVSPEMVRAHMRKRMKVHILLTNLAVS